MMRHEIEVILNYEFVNKSWLEQALAHKSYTNERRVGENNEKLEFVGDAVLDLVMAEVLYLNFPDDDEGDLSKKRASLVNESVLSEIATELKVMNFLKLGRGGDQQVRPRLLASGLEALIGAIYLDGGMVPAKEFVLRTFSERLKDESLLKNFDADFKSRLQEICQKKYREAPSYNLLEEVGPPHDRTFRMEVKIQGRLLAEAWGRSKKEAEQKAAQLALQAEESL